jgi:hypothetical protein
MLIAVGVACFLGGAFVGCCVGIIATFRYVERHEAKVDALIERLTGARLTPPAEAAPVRRAFGTDADEYAIEQQRLRASGKVLGEA